MRKQSFTLIEMLIVVVIIGILAAALIPRLQSVQARARDTKRKADLHQIATALEIYRDDNGNFDAFKNIPELNGFGIYPISNYKGLSTDETLWYSQMQTILGRYMTAVPTDSNQTTWFPNLPENAGIKGYGFGPLDKQNDPNTHLGQNGARTLDSFILFAKTESDGSSSNRVSDVNYPDHTCGSVICNTADNQDQLGSHYFGSNRHLGGAWGRDGSPDASARVYQDSMCTTVTFDSGTYNYGNSTCFANKNGDDLRYIYVN